MWEIDYHLIEPWLDSQDSRTVAAVFAALEILEQEGPALGRPLVDSIKGSRLGNLKELGPASPGRAEIRTLFAFDPARHAILLVAGDKSSGRHGWSEWYPRAMAEAEKLYRDHLNRMGMNE